MRRTGDFLFGKPKKISEGVATRGSALALGAVFAPADLWAAVRVFKELRKGIPTGPIKWGGYVSRGDN